MLSHDMLLPKPIPAFKDNYIWMLIGQDAKTAMVVDPGDAKPVLEILQQNNLTLTDVLITHHHFDHSGGALELMQTTKARVHGPNSSLFPGSHPLKEGDIVTFPAMKLTFRVMEIPGHTLDHIALYSEIPIQGHRILFCGDTLFTGGCGRVFEGTPPQMLNSLQRLKKLEKSTLVYCGHEYTEANLKFASIVEPENEALLERIKQVKLSRQNLEPTVPSTLEEELKTNPFLRTEFDSVRVAAEAYANQKLATEVEVFATIRTWKNNFS